MYFGCSAGNGKGNNLIVTCSSDFAGITITCTNGVKTYSKVCPSSEPYEIEFSGLESGTWTISGTVEGTLYSTNVVIADYTATLDSGFDYKSWCTEGGVDATQYSSLADVFADEIAVHRLMTVHASADYLIEAVSDDVDVIDDFSANDTAMKWIGLRDYVCDGLTAISGVEAKFLASQYWERYLKDHVPTMTSNNAPYGTVSGSGAYQSYYQYMAFDGNSSTKYVSTTANAYLQMQFVNPICVKKFKLTDVASYFIRNGATLSGSNDGSNFETIYTFADKNSNVTDEYYDCSGNNKYFLYYRLTNNSGVDTQIVELQFYGRQLSVSVPIMTSNTTPYGEVSSNSEQSASYAAYMAFKDQFDAIGSSNHGWLVVNTDSSGSYLDYEFDTPIVLKKVYIHKGVYQSYAINATIKGYDGSAWTDLITNIDLNANNEAHWGDIADTTSYEKLRVFINSGDLYHGYGLKVQYFGLDYSEREFEPNSGKKWLYDNGLELETITTSGTVTKGDDYLTLSAANSEATATVDLTNYSLLRGIVGDHMSGTTQLSVGGSNPATATLTTNYAPNNFSLGTSLFDQSLATGVKMTANGICDITELWLEQ